MKNSAKSNMYAYTLDMVWERYADHLEGPYDALVCVVSAFPLEDAAKHALASSFARLGYGNEACTFIVLHHGEQSVADHMLFELIEGLDPLCLVIADEEAAAACVQAYHQPFPLLQPCRILGRDTRAFSSFSGMLADDREKQKAWGLLKTLPRLER